MTSNEIAYCNDILAKIETLRSFLAHNTFTLDQAEDAKEFFSYLNRVPAIVGNISNDISFAATRLAGAYLADRFGITHFDAGAKAQGAPGWDIEARTADGTTICCELTTLRPCYPGCGEAQKSKLKNDLRKLAASEAAIKLMMVTDSDTFDALCKPGFARYTQGVEIVDLIAGRKFGQA